VDALKESHPPWRLFPPAEVAQALADSYLFHMQKVWETTSLALLRIAAAAWVRFEPRPLSPGQITSSFGSRAIDNPKLKEFLEANLNRKFLIGPHLPGIFPC
jgi:hypothetical protein